MLKWRFHQLLRMLLELLSILILLAVRVRVLLVIQLLVRLILDFAVPLVCFSVVISFLLWLLLFVRLCPFERPLLFFFNFRTRHALIIRTCLIMPPFTIGFGSRRVLGQDFCANSALSVGNVSLGDVL